MSRRLRPVDASALPALLAELVAARSGIVRVAVDGPECARPQELADALSEPLGVLGRPYAHIRAESFWRDASLRLEHGREDVDSVLSWLDVDALRREVLQPLGPGAAHSYLPSLRDPVSNRATREPARAAADGTVVAVSGQFLLGLGLPFDVTVHIAVSSAARARRTDADLQWTLPAFDRYDADAAPTAQADVVIRWDDPRHPAISDVSPRRVTSRRVE